jgi:hypothetical protein
VALLVIAGDADAGTITKAKVGQKLSTKESCRDGFCLATLKFTLKTTIEADISLSEAAGFQPNTVVHGSFPLGPSSSFRLTEDPNYEADDTSVKFSSTTVFNGIAWKRTITMSWNDQTLKLAVVTSVNQPLIFPAPVEWQGVPKTSDTKTSAGGLLVSLFAENLGTEFLNLEATVATKFKTSRTTKTTKKGDTVLASNQSIGGGKLLPK